MCCYKSVTPIQADNASRGQTADAQADESPGSSLKGVTHEARRRGLRAGLVLANASRSRLILTVEAHFLMRSFSARDSLKSANKDGSFFCTGNVQVNLQNTSPINNVACCGVDAIYPMTPNLSAYWMIDTISFTSGSVS